MKKIIILLTLSVSLLTQGIDAAQTAWYQHIVGSSYYDPAVQKKLQPFMLPQDHPMKDALDQIIDQHPHPLSDVDSFKAAGFVTLLTKYAGHERSAKWRLASHPLVPGYLFKVYLDSEGLDKNVGWKKLADRCAGAANIRKLIKDKGIRHFVVPDKFLIELPVDPTANQQPVMLMVTDMKLAPRPACQSAWRNVTKGQLNELYEIIANGFSSTYLVSNICLTRDGKFACIDTELPQRSPKLDKVKRYFSPKMRIYWERLVIAKSNKGRRIR
ncbi:MAG: hypothetical protein LLG04_10025 [Parachlamydia sp.]|nr:hypothetical protein [Parachlamydia sp.]